jgi:hypothetical protein
LSEASRVRDADRIDASNFDDTHMEHTMRKTARQPRFPIDGNPKQLTVEKGSQDGKSPIKSTGVRQGRILVGKGTYFAVCSMNTAFRKGYTMLLPAVHEAA